MASENDFQECAELLKALADPGRLRIVNILLQKEMTVSDLATELQQPMVNVSHHLRVLRSARIVHTRKQGKFVVYSIPPEIATIRDACGDTKTIDLGCCQLDLVQPELPENVASASPPGPAPKQT